MDGRLALAHSRRSSRVAETPGVYSGHQRQQQWYVLSAQGKLDVLKLISADEMVGDRRDLATLEIGSRPIKPMH